MRVGLVIVRNLSGQQMGGQGTMDRQANRDQFAQHMQSSNPHGNPQPQRPQYQRGGGGGGGGQAQPAPAPAPAPGGGDAGAAAGESWLTAAVAMNNP